MHDIIYDVAISADGFICDSNGNTDQFLAEGDHVTDYLARLQTYRCALMGRRTYEYGLAMGLPLGANPYPHMPCHILSTRLRLPEEAEVSLTSPDQIASLREAAEGPVYLCGGGDLAGWMNRQGLVDLLRLKINPIILGRGIHLWGPQGGRALSDARLTESRHYTSGVIYQEYRLT
ncbi:dihydrofolate reductase family protein [Pseudooceanicola sp.]|uniref:dihydrofolate reductase family protein n=1 Tax=Pseudooceanicola sp. TaxID=1914328 RepID=UPI0035C678FC